MEMNVSFCRKTKLCFYGKQEITRNSYNIVFMVNFLAKPEHFSFTVHTLKVNYILSLFLNTFMKKKKP